MKGLKICLSSLVLFVLSSIASSVLFSTGASAATDYDSVISTTDASYVRASSCDPIQLTNATTNWGDYMGGWNELPETPYSYQIQGTETTWDSARSMTKEKEYIGVTELPDGSIQAQIIWTDDPDATGEFHMVSGVPYFGLYVHPGYNLAIYSLSPDPTNCDRYYVEPNKFNFPSGVTYDVANPPDTSPGYVYYTYYNEFTVNYPEEYEGLTVPSSFPGDSSTAQPDIFMSSMVSFVGQFSDRNFLTFDGLPFMCGEFVPQINIEVFSETGGETLLDTLSTTASSQFSYTFPTSSDTRDYRIVSYYSCPEMTFDQVSFYDFQINSSGGLVAGIPCNAELFCSLNLPTYGLTQAIVSPLTFIGQIPTQVCEDLILPMPHGMQNITLPCMTPIYQTYLGPILLTYQTILTGMFAYYVSLKLFGNVKSLTNPRDDQVETVKL